MAHTNGEKKQKAENNEPKTKQKAKKEGDTITELCMWKMYASINVTFRLKRC